MKKKKFQNKLEIILLIHKDISYCFIYNKKRNFLIKIIIIN